MAITKIVVYGLAIVFCAVGCGLLYEAAVSFQDGVTTNASVMLIAGLVFGGVGLVVWVLAVAGQRKQARVAALQAAHPDEPWMWSEEWTNGRIRSMEKGSVWYLWGFAILWNLISTPLLVFLPEEITVKQNYSALVGLLFPLVGIGIVAFAVRRTMQRRKFGDCLFLMEQIPGVLGGEVTGTIMVPRGLPATEAVTVCLSCIHRQRQRTGKGTSTSEHLLWQAEPSIVRLSPTGEGETQRATVKFRVPYDASPTGQIDANNAIIWRLQADAAVPGVDFAAGFEIPVFKTSASSPQLTEEHLRSEDLSEGTPYLAPADQIGVSIVPSAGGGTEFILTPREGLQHAGSATILVLVFIGVTILLTFAGAPFIFTLVFGLFALLIAFGLVFGAFGESRIIVEDGHVSVRNSLFGIMMGRRMRCASITKISVREMARSQKRGSFSIVLTPTDGKPASPLQTLRDKKQADWLAEELRKAMEPWRGESGLHESDSQLTRPIVS